jgi:hypothetical protein
VLEVAGSGGGGVLCSSGYAPRVDEELEALRWLTVDELAAARRRAIKAWNLLDRTAPDYAQRQAALQRQLLKIRLVQD